MVQFLSVSRAILASMSLSARSYFMLSTNVYIFQDILDMVMCINSSKTVLYTGVFHYIERYSTAYICFLYVVLSNSFPSLSHTAGSLGLRFHKFHLLSGGFWLLSLPSTFRHLSSSYCPLHCLASDFSCCTFFYFPSL